jgi:hypothetical protein
MKEDENIAAYFLRVHETVNVIKGLGEEIKGSVVVQKILKSLPLKLDPKITALEERADLATLSMNELHQILTTYEMRKELDNPSKLSKHPRRQERINKRQSQASAATIIRMKMKK